MGGSAFSPELHTPRMPPHVYQHMRDQVLQTLRKSYKRVDCPIETPAKQDYGDIDVVAYEPRVTAQDKLPDNDSIGAALRAQMWKADKGTDEVHYALHWPDEAISTRCDHISQLGPWATKDRHIQLDLHICQSKDAYDWHLFRCAHGDFWTITGSVIRLFGLSFRYDGLYIHIAKLEKPNKKLSLVRLSNTPSDVLSFLFEGDVEKKFWHRNAFCSVEEMCNFIRHHCRFYRPRREREIIDGEDGTELPGQKTHDSRLTKRGTFRYWQEEFLPKHSPGDREAGLQGEHAALDREQVAELAQERFGMRREYDEKEAVALRQLGEEKLWADLRASLSQEVSAQHGVHGMGVHAVVRALRRRVSGEGSGKEDGQLDGPQRAYRDGRFEEVKVWAEGNWKKIIERAESGQRSGLQYVAKATEGEEGAWS